VPPFPPKAFARHLQTQVFDCRKKKNAQAELPIRITHYLNASSRDTLHLNHLRDFARRRARGRHILRASIRRLRGLHLDAILLAVVVVALILSSSAIVSRVAVCLAGAVRGRGLLLAVVLVVVVVGRGRVVVAGHGARGPASAVEGLAAGFATTAGR
jgi:hypothetical protein